MTLFVFLLCLGLVIAHVFVWIAMYTEYSDDRGALPFFPLSWSARNRWWNAWVTRSRDPVVERIRRIGLVLQVALLAGVLLLSWSSAGVLK